MSTDGPTRDERFVEQLATHLDGRAPGAGDEPDGGILDAVDLALRAEATWAGPPPELRAAVLAAVERDADGVEDAAVPLRPRRRRWWAVPAAAAAAVAFTVGILAVQRALEPRGETYAAAGTALAPGASASVSVLGTGAGFKITVDTENLPAAAPGSYYAAWLTGPRGVVPLGSFHERRTGTPIALWSGVDPAAYPTFTVTLQAEGDPPVPSTRVVLTADLRR